MTDVLVRQWGPGCYATYINRGGTYPDFVGTEATRGEAEDLGRSLISEGGNRYEQTGSGGASGIPEHLSGGQLGDAQRERANAPTAGLDPTVPAHTGKRGPA